MKTATPLSLVVLVVTLGAASTHAALLERTKDSCANDLQVLRNAIMVLTPKGEELDLQCNMTYNPCDPGALFR